MSTPRANASPGHRYARHARRRQTSVPTTASASRSMPSSRIPVANSQWTCSEGGSIVPLEALQRARHDDEVEEEPRRDDEQRRLDEQPPEALPVRMEQGDAVPV